MSFTVYQILHVSSVILLVALTFGVCAAPRPEIRKISMIKTGLLSVVVLVSGFGLVAKFGYGFPIWVVVKLVCFLGIAVLSGVAFRKPESAGKLSLVVAVLVVVAVCSVYYLKPMA